MNPDTLLREVPTIEEWATTHACLDELTLDDVPRLEGAYWQTFAVRVPAFDQNGYPTVPPDEHVLDGYARAWLPAVEEPASLRAGFGTVVVVPELVPCDICQWGAARYESRVGPRREVAVLCLRCLVRRGDASLGPGHSVMMLLPEELNDSVRARLAPHLASDALTSWTTERSGDGWDAYRRWGFVGPDGSGTLYTVILNVQMCVGPGPLDSVKVVAQSADTRFSYEPGGDTYLGPRGLDDLDVRAFLLYVLNHEVHTARARDHLDHYFAVEAIERDQRAVAALDHGGGARWLTLGEHLLTESADYQMSRAAASESDSPSVVDRIARAHPDAEIRRLAIANETLTSEVLARIAADRDAHVTGALLERTDLPATATERVVETLLLSGSLRLWEAILALKRADFPETLLDSLVERIYAGGTQSRIKLAQHIHDAPADRRDWVHLHLLRRARKIPSTLELIEAIVAMDEERSRWLAHIQDWKVRELMRWSDSARTSTANAVGE